MNRDNFLLQVGLMDAFQQLSERNVAGPQARQLLVDIGEAADLRLQVADLRLQLRLPALRHRRKLVLTEAELHGVLAAGAAVGVLHNQVLHDAVNLGYLVVHRRVDFGHGDERLLHRGEGDDVRLELNLRLLPWGPQGILFSHSS